MVESAHDGEILRDEMKAQFLVSTEEKYHTFLCNCMKMHVPILEPQRITTPAAAFWVYRI